MLSSEEGVALNVSRSGQPVYFYTTDEVKLNGSVRLAQLVHDKGVGTLANTKLPQSTAVYSEQSASICVVGDNELHICKRCYAKILQKAKARDDYPRITFCSDSCLQQAAPYLDFCGPMLQDIATYSKDVEHILKLAVHFVYSVSMASTAAALAHLLQVLDLAFHPESSTEGDQLIASAKWLYSRFSTHLSGQTLRALGSRGIPLNEKVLGESVLCKLMRIIKFNAQSVPVHGVPKAQLMCLVYSVARINHSCTPNCALVYDVYCHTDHAAVDTTTTTTTNTTNTASSYFVKISVLALRDIQPDEELTMSYIQPLCSSADLRQTLLLQGFLFTCRCERCMTPQLPAELAAQCTNLETLLNNAAQSSDKAANYVGLVELESAAELVLQQFSDVDDTQKPSLPVHSVHDAASFVLQRATQGLKSASTSTGARMDPTQQGSVVHLIVRANLTLSKCWGLISCAHLLQRAEIAISGSNYAVQLRKLASVLKVKFTHIDSFRSELDGVLAVMRTVYGCGTHAISSTSGGGSGDSRSADNEELVPRDSSTLPYIHKLYQKGMENYQALK